MVVIFSLSADSGNKLSQTTEESPELKAAIATAKKLVNEQVQEKLAIKLAAQAERDRARQARQEQYYREHPSEAPKASKKVQATSAAAKAREEGKLRYFEMTFPTAAFLKQVVRTLGSITEEITFYLDKDGLVAALMDPSHICLVDVRIPAAELDSYKYESQQPEETFTVHTDDFLAVLAVAENSPITLSIQDFPKQEPLLHISIEGPVTSELDLHLVDAYTSKTPMPKVTFKSKFKLNSAWLEKVLKEQKPVSDHLHVQSFKGEPAMPADEAHNATDATPDKLVFSGKGEVGNASKTLKRTDADLIELDIQEDSDVYYSSEYLRNYLKALKAEQVTMEFASKMPCRLGLEFAHGGHNYFYLAPRVD
jgi:DNA polymerase III sliding clamp (beta) subunit (PCNA family)